MGIGGVFLTKFSLFERLCHCHCHIFSVITSKSSFLRPDGTAQHDRFFEELTSDQ